MINVLYDNSAEALYLLNIIYGEKEKSALWIFFSKSDESCLNNIITALAPLYSWAIQNDEYIDPIHAKIKDYKSAFGKLGMTTVLKKRIFNKKFTIDEKNYYFDFSKIDALEFIQLMRISKTEHIGFITCAEDIEPSEIYKLAVSEAMVKKITMGNYGRLIYGDTLDGNSVVVICDDDCSIKNIAIKINNAALISQHEYISKYIKTSKGTLTPLFTTSNLSTLL